MRKLFVLFAFVPFFFACSKEDTDNVLSTPIDVTKIGDKVTNPMNLDSCKNEDVAEATLSSLRRISDVLYTMYYTADLHLNELVEGDYRTRDAFENAFASFMFKSKGAEPALGNSPKACSGFVCNTPGGELLLGRNFDGAHGPMLLLFNTANGYKYIQCTAPNYNSALYAGPDGLHGDGVLSDGKTSLHRLMREPLATMDGMNEHGLCFGAYQLPNFDENNPELKILFQNTGKKAISASLMHNLILSRCKTVKEVEALLRSYDMINILSSLNVHWMIADATGDWALFEYWNDTLYVMRAKELYYYGLSAGLSIPYEWYSIENYYRHPDAYLVYPAPIQSDPYNWQVVMSAKTRVSHMMNFYNPTMTEKEAMNCLQQGRYSIEVPNDFTNWSCIYNPSQRTITFAMRNDVSKVYTVDLKKVF